MYIFITEIVVTNNNNGPIKSNIHNIHNILEIKCLPLFYYSYNNSKIMVIYKLIVRIKEFFSYNKKNELRKNIRNKFDEMNEPNEI